MATTSSQSGRPIFHPATGSRLAVFHGSPSRRRSGAPGARAKLDSLSDVNAVLAALPHALVLDGSPDGLTLHIVGDLARVDVDRMNDPATAEPALRAGMVRLPIWDRDSARVESTCWSW
jgi:hypothetical protein